jgi:hypothetical protein
MGIDALIMNYLHISVVKLSVQSAKVPVLQTQVNWSIIQVQQLAQLSNIIPSDSMATPNPVQAGLSLRTIGSKEEFYGKLESIRKCPIQKYKTPLTPSSHPIPSTESSNLTVLPIG